MQTHSLTSLLHSFTESAVFRYAKYIQGFTKFVTCNAESV